MKKRPAHGVLAAVNMPIAAPEQRSADELLDDLEQLDEAVRKKVEISSDEVTKRYEVELAPKLDEIRKLVARRSPIARNAAEDALVRFREFLITAGAPLG